MIPILNRALRQALAALLTAVLALPLAPSAEAAQRQAKPLTSAKHKAVSTKKKRAMVQVRPRAQPAAAARAAKFAPLRREAAVRPRAVGARASMATGAALAAGAVWAGAGVGDGEEATWFHEGLRLHSSAVLVLDADTNAVLLNKNDEAVLPIASLTKLMTALVVVDAGLPMDEVLTITEDDVDRLKGTGSRLAVGTRLTRAEALHLALMASENRAAHALGRTYPGGIPAFVAAMNNKAFELGLMRTRFVEPTGLSRDNRSSPRDLARLVAAASTRPLLRELSVSPGYELADGGRVVHYRNSNKLVRDSEWDILLQKTGYIREAGRCVAMQVRLAGRNVIMVLMNAGNSAARWADAEQLLQWLQRTLVSAAPAPRT